VHLTPKARAFFSLAISEKNVAFAKSSLLLAQVTSTLGVENWYGHRIFRAVRVVLSRQLKI